MLYIYVYLYPPNHQYIHIWVSQHITYDVYLYMAISSTQNVYMYTYKWNFLFRISIHIPIIIYMDMVMVYVSSTPRTSSHHWFWLTSNTVCIHASLIDGFELFIFRKSQSQERERKKRRWRVRPVSWRRKQSKWHEKEYLESYTHICTST